MSATAHPAATHHLPMFITAPGETDVLMVVTAVILLLATLGFGLVFLRIHTLPERMAHRTHKLQFEIVAVLGLLALFTHIHLFWVAGLLLAMIDLPDFGTPLNRIAGGVEKIAGIQPPPEEGVIDVTPGGKDHAQLEHAAVEEAKPGEPKPGEPVRPAAKRPELVPAGS